jgi:hypothetical protein
MTGDLVKQSIAELQDLVRCRCHPVYKDLEMHDPDCDCDSADAVQVVADRIEELEAREEAILWAALERAAEAAYSYKDTTHPQEDYDRGWANCSWLVAHVIRAIASDPAAVAAIISAAAQLNKEQRDEDWG